MNTDSQGATFKEQRWRTYFFCLLALCVITALEVCFYYRENTSIVLYILSSLAIGGGAYGWVYYDAQEKGIRLTKNMKTAVGLFGPIAIPIYFVKSRGFRVAVKTGFGLTLYVPFYVLYYVVWIATADFLKAIGYFS